MPRADESKRANEGLRVAAPTSQSKRLESVDLILAAADRDGLLRGKAGRIGVRISPILIERAKARTGIESDTDLLEFALANFALDDPFPEAFKKARGTIDADIDLEF